jgi:hypothetical protein
MQDNIIDSFQEIDVVRLLKFIRQEEENEHIAQLCADVSSEFARISRYVGKVGFALSEEWKVASRKEKSADHLVLIIKEHKTRLMALHIRSTGDHDNQGVDVSQNILRHRESEPVSFALPEQFVEAKNYILAEIFSAFPKDRLEVKFGKGKDSETVPLFEEVVENADAPDVPEGYIGDKYHVLGLFPEPGLKETPEQIRARTDAAQRQSEQAYRTALQYQ